MNPLFWQLLLAAETNTEKSRILEKAFGSDSDLTPQKFASHKLLTEAEAKRVKECKIDGFERALARGAQFLTQSDYSEALLSTPWPPSVLATLGDTSCIHRPTVGIVGTRNASVYGRAAASKFAEKLAKSGVTVISGGALGIDAAAHEGAMTGQGKTVAVLAGGLDRLYPAMHASLFKRITENGCLVTSYAFGTKPIGYRFLARNSLIALLSQAVLVVEAPERSGALSTAHAAGELGRPVYVVPATIDQVSFRGSHSLIRDGATLVDHPDQLLEALDVPLSESLPFDDDESLTDAAAKILKSLTVQVKRIELIAEETGLNPEDLLAEMTLLEMDGRVIRDSGGFALVP